MKSGIVYLPYTFMTSTSIISSDFTTKKVIKSRYSIVSIYDQLLIDRKNKIDKIISNIQKNNMNKLQSVKIINNSLYGQFGDNPFYDILLYRKLKITKIINRIKNGK